MSHSCLERRLLKLNGCLLRLRLGMARLGFTLLQRLARRGAIAGVAPAGRYGSIPFHRHSVSPNNLQLMKPSLLVSLCGSFSA